MAKALKTQSPKAVTVESWYFPRGNYRLRVHPDIPYLTVTQRKDNTICCICWSRSKPLGSLATFRFKNSPVCQDCRDLMAEYYPADEFTPLTVQGRKQIERKSGVGFCLRIKQ